MYFYPFLFLYNVFHEEMMNEETVPLISDSGTPSPVVPPYLLFRKGTVFNWTILKRIN